MDEDSLNQQIDMALEAGVVMIKKLAAEDNEYFTYLAKATRKYHQELIAAGFTRQEATGIIQGFGGAFGKTG